MAIKELEKIVANGTKRSRFTEIFISEVNQTFSPLVNGVSFMLDQYNVSEKKDIYINNYSIPQRLAYNVGVMWGIVPSFALALGDALLHYYDDCNNLIATIKRT